MPCNVAGAAVAAHRASAASGVRCLCGALHVAPCRRWALARRGRCRRGASGRQCGTRRRHAEAVPQARCEQVCAAPMRRARPPLERARARAGAYRARREQARSCSRPTSTPRCSTPREGRSRRAAAMLLSTPAARRAQRAASRRRALAPLGARSGARMAAVHGARCPLAEPQPPVARLPRHGVGRGGSARPCSGVGPALGYHNLRNCRD